MLRNRFFRRFYTRYLIEIDQTKIVYMLSLLVDVSESIDTVMETFRKTDAWNLPVLDKGFYVGFLSKSRVYATYRELLIQVSEE